MLYLYVENADELYKQALTFNGTKSKPELRDESMVTGQDAWTIRGVTGGSLHMSGRKRWRTLRKKIRDSERGALRLMKIY
jgi:hypothetical protein